MMFTKTKTPSPYALRYWPVWFVIAICYLMTKLISYRGMLRLGRVLGLIALCTAKRTVHVTKVNISKCFPHLSPQQQARLLKANFQSAGMGLMETAMSWWKHFPDPNKMLQLQGHQHYLDAMQRGKGALLLCPHLSSLELVGRLFTKTVPFAVMYNKIKHPVLEMINRRHLEKHFTHVMPREDLYGLVDCLQKNIFVFYTPDIDPGRKRGTFADFFGVQAYSLTTTARLARMTNTTVLPCAFYRRSDYSGYDAMCYPPLPNFPSDDETQNALQVNQVMQHIIEQHPEQYFWQYKRFKTRPAGEADFYCYPHP